MPGRRALGGVGGLATAALLAVAPTAGAATFTVTSNADSGAGTLRQAILDANATAGADTVNFSAGMEITPASALPQITEQVTVAGTAGGCAGPPLGVEIDGAGGAFSGFDVGRNATGTEICRLSIVGFTDNGILTAADDTLVAGNLIGIDGSLSVDANGTGVYVQDFADGVDGVVIGGTGLAGNVVSGNTHAGIRFRGTGSGHLVRGNLIGTDTSGTASAGAQTWGVDVDDGIDVTVGGTTAAEGNVISGNGNSGVYIAEGRVEGNLIGTDVTGTAAVPNATAGVYVRGEDVVVGGTATGAGNTISGNGSYGVFAVDPTTIQGNRIGTSAAGTAPLAAPQTHGVYLQSDAGGSLVGGSASGAVNVISGNADKGVYVLGVDDVAVQGNLIGTDATGSSAIPNDTGVETTGANTVIGGTAAGEGNLIAGNTNASDIGNGVYDLGAGTTIQGNEIGLAADGTALANDRGIRLGSISDGAQIGGTAAGAGNVISGNDTSQSTSAGILAGQNSANATIQGNVIGLAPDGVTPRPNDSGIRVDKSIDITIGGGAAGAGNVISGNSRVGLTIAGGTTENPVVQGNMIGTDAGGTLDLGNGQQGVFLTNATNALIGGTGAGEGNVIAHNGFEGIDAGPGSGTLLGARFLGNRIFDNDEFAIDLEGGSAGEGPDANDAGDVDDDTNPNRLQNFPVLTAAVTDGSQSEIAGTIDTTPGHTIRVELFSSAACDPSGFGEAEQLLGFVDVVAGSGPTPFTANVAGTTAGHAVTATATNFTTGDSSELSQCLTAQAGTFAPPPAPPPPPPPAPAPVPPPAAPAPAAVPVPAPVAPASAVAPVTPKLPAKLRVLRAGIVDGKLDMLIEITGRAETPGAELELEYESNGRTSTFTVPIEDRQVKVLEDLPSSQATLDTGIVEVTYAGNDVVAPDEVRVRAASGKSKLTRGTVKIEGGELVVDGTITSKAKGVVRVRMQYDEPDGSTGFLFWNATIAKGEWGIEETLPAQAAAGGHLSIQFTGYLPEKLRGEQTSKQVLP